MTKLEKVIKWLEVHRKSPTCVNDDGEICPYFSYDDCSQRIMYDAIELLKSRSEQSQESINNDWSGAQGSDKERIDAQIERSKWGIFG